MTPSYQPDAFSHILTPAEFTRWADSLRWVRKTPRRRELFMHDPAQVAIGLRYSYTPRNTYTSEPADPIVLRIMRELNERNGSKLNVCFLNRYDSERDGLAWHADDEETLDDEQPIEVVSFGASREIQTRKKGHKGAALPECRWTLAHGSRFTMPPGFQDTDDHQIPGAQEPT